MFRGEKFGLDNSANLMKMAQWAERNDFDDKSRQYMAMADRYQQREIEESKREKLAEAQLGVSKLLTEMQGVATNKDIPTAERTMKINELSLQAQGIASAGGMNPVSVVNPTNEFLNYIATADANTSATAVLNDANALKTDIGLAIASGDVTKAQRLLADLPGLRSRAAALNDPDLLADVDAGIQTMMAKLPDAQETEYERRAARAFEYFLDSGDAEDSRAMQITAQPQTREIFRKKVAEHEAAKKAEERLEAELAGINLRNQKLQGELQTAEDEGTLIPATQFAALKAAGEYDKYFTAWTNMADLPYRRQQLNKDMRARNKALQDMQDGALQDKAAMYVLQAPRFIEQMETDDWDFGKDLDNWVELYASTLTDQNTVNMLSKVIAGDPRFPEANDEEQKKIALERVITHLLATDEYFSEAFKANESQKARREDAAAISLEENEIEWQSVSEGGLSVNTYPEHPNGYYRRKLEETNMALEQAGKDPMTEDEFRTIYTNKYKKPVVAETVVSTGGSRANPSPDVIGETLAGEIIRPRQRGRKARQPAPKGSNGPSLLQRQRDNLSPPIGPMGDIEDYQTKLRQAREAMPNSPYQGSFLTDFPETAPPYIDPRYKNFGG
jgi:hypothetical protein